MSGRGRVAVRELSLGGQTVRYTLRRSERARRLSLRVLPGTGLEVVLPRGRSQRDAEAFVRQEQDWVLRALARQAEQRRDLRDGATLPFLDERLTLRLVTGTMTRATRVDGTLVVTTIDPTEAASALERWYRARAREHLGALAREHAARLGVEAGRVAIKDTRTRWGSCSTLGNLNFSWRLMLAPGTIAEYVVAHEVAHLREMNHSPRFWEQVESLCPDYRARRRWLREHGAALAGWPGTDIPAA